VDEVFGFFSDPRNLERLTPPSLRFQVLAASTPSLQSGTLIDYRLHLHGVPVRWQSRIEEWAPGRRFVDVQVRGPYRLWHHTHEFEPRDGGTVIRDVVRYSLPLEPLGSLIAGGTVRRDLARIFDFRHETVRRLFDARAAVVSSAGSR
jgi:ligand-binding SRPBCC domain-containing protein